MNAQIKAGRTFGIEIGLPYSRPINAASITHSLFDHFRRANPHRTGALRG